MEYIDKQLKAPQGEAIVREFLTDVYNSAGNTFAVGHGLYDVLRGRFAPYFHRMRNLLYDEQNGVCCYCMRRLNADNQSVEHLIEKNFRPTDNWADYMTPSTILQTKVCLESDFVRTNVNVTYSKFPHSVAYQNMVLSCKGQIPNQTSDSKTCNLKRQHHTIAPFVLVPTINQDFCYKKNGFVFWKNDPRVNDPAVNVLKLNHATLRMIRRIWFYAKDKNINVAKIDDRSEFLYGLLDEQIEELSKDNGWHKILLFLREKYWKMLLEFDYFGTDRPTMI